MKLDIPSDIADILIMCYFHYTLSPDLAPCLALLSSRRTNNWIPITPKIAAITKPNVVGKPYPIQVRYVCQVYGEVENLRKSGAIVCGNITIGNHAATAYWKPFMLLTTTARSSLFPAQTSLAQE
jgi:hypothetical protein